MKSVSILLCLVSLVTPSLTQISLGTASTYGALSVTGITNVGLTIVNGDIGSTGAAITGFGPGVATGTTELGTAAVIQAKVDALIAFTTAQGLTGAVDLTTTSDLGGKTLLPGVYMFSSSAAITGILTLDAAGNPAATWVFQIGSTLITASASSVVLINGASACNVFWAVGSSATLGTTTALVGHVLAAVSISLTAGASVNGGLYAGAAITFIDNQITPGNCGTAVTTTTTTLPTSVCTLATVTVTAAPTTTHH